MDKYLFLHIPKTAGVKIRHNIHMNLVAPQGRVCVQEEGFDLGAMTDAELQDFDIISGHFGAAVRRRLEPGRRCVSMLRSPCPRFISLYFYWKTLAGTYLAQLAHTLSIYEFAASNNPVIVEYVDNAQTWQFFHDFQINTRLRFAGRARSEILTGAGHNLRAFDCVGIHEDMEGTLAKMAKTFAWQWTDTPAARINKTPDYDVSQIDLDLLRKKLGDRLALDEELYAQGLERFNSN